MIAGLANLPVMLIKIIAGVLDPLERDTGRGSALGAEHPFGYEHTSNVRRRMRS